MTALREVVIGGTIYAAGAELPPLNDRQRENCIKGGVIAPEAEAVEKPENDIVSEKTATRRKRK